MQSSNPATGHPAKRTRRGGQSSDAVVEPAKTGGTQSNSPARNRGAKGRASQRVTDATREDRRELNRVVRRIESLRKKLEELGQEKRKRDKRIADRKKSDEVAAKRDRVEAEKQQRKRIQRQSALRRAAQARGWYEVLDLDPTVFEIKVEQLLRKRGFRLLRHVGGAKDKGADITCVSPDRKEKTVVQCKLYDPDRGRKVGSKEVQLLLGALQSHVARRGILVTTTSFTDDARQRASQHPIELVDGEELQRWLDKAYGQE